MMLERQSLRGDSESIASKIAARIAAGVLPPESTLPSVDSLAREFGCSESLMQGVLQGLVISGLITPLEHGLYCVSRPPPDPIETLRTSFQVLELRAALEPETAALAAHRRSDDDLAAVWAAFRAMQDVPLETFEQFALADMTFHLAIAKAAGNPLFLRVLEPMLRDAVQENVDRQRQLQNASRKAFLKRAHREHALIVSAIARRDASDARRQLKRHFQLPLRRYRALLGLHTELSD